MYTEVRVIRMSYCTMLIDNTTNRRVKTLYREDYSTVQQYIDQLVSYMKSNNLFEV